MLQIWFLTQSPYPSFRGLGGKKKQIQRTVQGCVGGDDGASEENCTSIDRGVSSQGQGKLKRGTDI